MHVEMLEVERRRVGWGEEWRRRRRDIVSVLFHSLLAFFQFSRLVAGEGWVMMG
jgi:hypothetical protein